MVKGTANVLWYPWTGAMIGSRHTTSTGTSGSAFVMNFGSGAEIVGVVASGRWQASNLNFYSAGPRASVFRSHALFLMDTY